jgi:hypothetical protein
MALDSVTVPANAVISLANTPIESGKILESLLLCGLLEHYPIKPRRSRMTRSSSCTLAG